MPDDGQTRPLRPPGDAPPNLYDQHEHALLGHDLRAALSEVRAGLQMIRGLAVPPHLQDPLDQCSAAGESLSRLIDQSVLVCLGQAAPGPATLTEVDTAKLASTLHHRWSGRAAKTGHRLDLSLDTLPAQVLLDLTVFDRIVTNLLTNALDHTPPGPIRLALTPDGATRVRLVVRDSGPGLPAAQMRIFDPATTSVSIADKVGHGLGLHSVNYLVRALGGEVRIRNPQDGGAEFTVLLPAMPTLPRDSSPGCPPAALPPDLTGVRILVADDNATSRDMVSMLATRAGAEVRVVSTGAGALAEAQRCLPDILILDDEMPGMAGRDVLVTLRSMGGALADLPVLAVTSHLGQLERARLLQAGATDVLAKPIVCPVELGHAVLATVARARPAAPAFDPTALQRLLVLAGPDAAMELLDRLEEDLTTAQRALVDGVQHENLSVVAAQTHVLVALAGTAGDAALQHQAEDLNTLAHGPATPDQLHALARQIDTGIDRLVAALSAERQQEDQIR